jgi:F420-dependent oxidoreductase-like protein
MRLALSLGYWGAGQDAGNLALAQAADRLGYDSCWAAEAYGSDSPTVLAWVAAQTERIGIGAAVMQIPARTPAATAMTAATLDTLSGGRFRLGLGVSGPQVSEGWHGVRFDRPLERTREYVDIVRLALARKTVRYDGTHWQLPLPDGPGRALRLGVHPVRERIPIYLAAVGPRNLELAGEIADGWLGIFFAPEHAGLSLDPLLAGRRTAGNPERPWEGFDLMVTVPTVLGDERDRVEAPLRDHAALYLGGMGSRQRNFYNALARRMGYDREAQQVQDLYLDQRYRDAAAAVPRDFVETTCLVGDSARVRDRLQAYADAGISTLGVAPLAGSMPERLAALHSVAEALEAAGLAQ